MPRVYFFCGNEEGNLQEDVIALAEGFVELGIQFYANCDYWLQSTRPNDYLIRHHPDVMPDDCDIVVVSYTWPRWVKMKSFDLVQKPLPSGLFKESRKYVSVFMDNFDGHRTISWEPEYRRFDIILRSKLNRRAWHPENMRPWAYGWPGRSGLSFCSWWGTIGCLAACPDLRGGRREASMDWWHWRGWPWRPVCP